MRDARRPSARSRLATAMRGAPSSAAKPVLPRAPAHVPAGGREGGAGSRAGEGGCGGFGRRPLPGPVGAGVGLVRVCCRSSTSRTAGDTPVPPPPRAPRAGTEPWQCPRHGDHSWHPTPERENHLRLGFTDVDLNVRGWARSYFPS